MTSESVDPRKTMKSFDATVTFETDAIVARVNFECLADLLDARYELISLNNGILVYDTESEEYVVIEPNRVQSSENQITLTATREEEDE